MNRKQLIVKDYGKEFMDRIKYFYYKLSGKYEYPNSAEGDLIRMAHKYIEYAEDKIFHLEETLKAMKVQNNDLLELSSNLNEHPEDYNGPCMCKLCQSYGE